MQKNDWFIFGCKVGQSVPLKMKRELDLCRRLVNMYTMFPIDISKHGEKIPENPKRAKIMAKILKIRYSKKRNLFREVLSGTLMYQLWRTYLDLWGHACKKRVWLSLGCKVGKLEPIMMTLKLDMSYHPLNLYTKFQIDISKHVGKKYGKLERTNRWKYRRAYKNIIMIDLTRIPISVRIHG